MQCQVNFAQSIIALHVSLLSMHCRLELEHRGAEPILAIILHLFASCACMPRVGVLTDSLIRKNVLIALRGSNTIAIKHSHNDARLS